MLTSVNLSLSSVCGANCIFCPANRGRRIKQKLMPFEYAEKIINEISSKEFKKHHNITRINVGENGDAFLNKDLIRILRLIKLKLPWVRVAIITNFQNFTNDKIKTILGEKLVDEFGCNIDGFNKQNYFNVKKLDLKNTRNNLMNFLRARNKFNCYPKLYVWAMTLNRYIQTIRYNFNFYPAKLENHDLVNVSDDFLIIKEKLEKILDPNIDKICEARAWGWAEREKINTQNINYKKYSCSRLFVIQTEAFIAPDGIWYACCLDSNNELVLGNVIKQSINEIFFSKKRQKLIKLLKNKQFAKIGGPCKTVNCCQDLSKNRIEAVVIKVMELKIKLLQRIKRILKLILPKFAFSIIFVLFRKIKSIIN